MQETSGDGFRPVSRVRAIIAGVLGLGAAATVMGARQPADAADAPPIVVPPIGTIVAHAGPLFLDPQNEQKYGWLRCDGRALPIQGQYNALFNAILASWGTPNQLTSFNIPDLQGRFLRGVDHASGRDPDALSRTAAQPGGNTGDFVGSVQSSAFMSHTHDVSQSDHSHGIAVNAPGDGSSPKTGGGQTAPSTTGGAKANITIVAQGGNETRPINAAVHYIIRFQ
jgi:microcystin-dependent protein